MHDIGKNIVNMMLEGAGFTVVDLGVDLTLEKLMEEIERLKPDLLGLSALLTTVIPEMERAVRENWRKRPEEEHEDHGRWSTHQQNLC